MYWLSAAERLMAGAPQSRQQNSLNLEGDGLINLIHYEDAADLTLKVLTQGIIDCLLFSTIVNLVSDDVDEISRAAWIPYICFLGRHNGGGVYGL